MQKKCQLCESVRQFLLSIIAGAVVAALTIKAGLSAEFTFWGTFLGALLALMYFGYTNRKKTIVMDKDIQKK